MKDIEETKAKLRHLIEENAAFHQQMHAKETARLREQLFQLEMCTVHIRPDGSTEIIAPVI